MPTSVFEVVPKSFRQPEQLPRNAEEAAEWQSANRTFWETNPMRYDWHEGVEQEARSAQFFAEVDRRFLEGVRAYMPWQRYPFEQLLDFDVLGSKNVLEIGVGMGTHAQLIAKHARSYVGIDLTEYAVVATRERLRLAGLEGTVVQMDAEQLDFPDESFDLIWTWGVIHHSSNTQRILGEMRRVLRPGGQAMVMVYNRGWWDYYVCGCFIHGLIRGGVFKHGNFGRAVQATSDGALSRFYSKHSWRELSSPYFTLDSVIINGNKAEILPIPSSRLKTAILNRVPDAVTRCMTRDLRMGSFLIAKMTRTA
jgi:ubiquinone/menaquinone biosynthesis C-methylase UbiE